MRKRLGEVIETCMSCPKKISITAVAGSIAVKKQTAKIVQMENMF